MPLITLNRNQFLKKRPKGDYAAYLKYVNTRRAGRPVGRGQGSQVQLPMNPEAVNQALLQNIMSGSLSPKQQRQQAVQSVNDAIKLALGELRGTTAAAQKQATDQARAYEGFAKMLAQERRTDAGYVTDLYRDAAADQARFASGITGAVGDAARADAAAQQADVQAATGQSAGYHGPDPGATQSVGYFLGGQIPSGRFSENAAYAGQDMLRQGLASASRLGLESSAMRQKAIDLQGELARERAKLIAGRPGAIREAMKGLSDDQRANLATLAQVLYLQNTQANTTADLTGQYQGQDTINTYRDANGVIRRYNPNTHIVKTSKNGTQFLAPLPQPASSSSNPRDPKTGLTKGQQQTADRMREEALQGGRADMLKVLQNRKGPLYNQPDPLLGTLGKATPKSYAAAKKYLMTNFANDLIRQYPKYKAQILSMVEQSLASAGFKRGSGAAASSRVPQTGSPSVPTLTPPGGGFVPGR